MTALDRMTTHPGYWPSPWPVECGGNRRQKASPGRLDAADGEVSVVTRNNGRWNVMVVGREPGQWYLGGTMANFTGPPPFGWVERINPSSLDTLASSPQLPCGDHVWCGAILAHANGSIYSVNGSYLHRLDPSDLDILAERQLPSDRSHNGLLALADGTLITKDLRLEGQGGTTLTRLDPDTLDLVHEPLLLPEGSMGRIAADIVSGAISTDHINTEHITTDDINTDDITTEYITTEYIYVPGIEHLWRVVVEPDELTIDTWRPRYRAPNDQFGLAWDACLSDDACWIMDCGDVPSVRHIHSVEPNGRYDQAPGRALSWRQPAPWTGGQRLLRTSTLEQGDVATVEPFGNPGGGIIAPPVHVPEHDVAIAWDSINGGLAGIDTTDPAQLSTLWQLDVRPSMQPVVFPESGELAINDFTDAGSDDIIVVDLRSGELLDRVDTGSRIGNGMFLTPDGDRGLFYCSTLTVAHVRWG